ncbi:hypothetical protein [Fundidesulfovibrio terrae]|uniref:hypothetical protein n=1 Tax=Fundidesulfovibrio terrae TaxID=2922866 RepID=UPI001FB02C2B|nr:hypothetical protein [Fundidesulfovibrio terrae]
MSERLGDPKFENYTLADDVDATLGPVLQTNPEDNRGYPKPFFDDPSWTPGQREINARLQHLFRGNVYDAIAPSMSERFKPGFDPKSIPPSANSPLTGTGMSSALDKAGMGFLGPFGWMAKAEDTLEQAMGKQIWDRPDPAENEKWWLENHD